jgi:predicted component of type VI protein secretion system
MDGVKQQANKDSQEETKSIERLQTARFLKLFIDTVLNTKETISFENRVKLENDIRQLGDKAITTQWETFIKSTDTKLAQEAAVKLMSMLGSKMI